jgi:methyl-accepting chemotaxis protein
MSFDDAVNSHSEWKRTLYEYAAHPDGSMKMSEVAENDRCKLGQWIRGDGKKYSAYPEFARLAAEHTRFHKAAAEIVRRVDCGEDVSGEFALGVGSEFSLASSSVVLALMDMKRRHEMQGRGGHDQDRIHEQSRARKHAAGWAK